MLTIYSKPACPFCDMAKAYLQEQAVPFEVKDISADDAAREFVLGEGHRTVPQIYKDGELFVEGGFQGLKDMGRSALLEKLGM